MYTVKRCGNNYVLIEESTNLKLVERKLKKEVLTFLEYCDNGAGFNGSTPDFMKLKETK